MTPEVDQWRRRVSSSDCRNSTLRLAFTLAALFGPDGAVTVSKATLADQSGLSDWTVNAALRELNLCGFLRVTHEKDPDTGQDLPSSYAFNYPDPNDTEAILYPSPQAESDGESDATGDLVRDPELDGDADGASGAGGDLETT